MPATSIIHGPKVCLMISRAGDRGRRIHPRIYMSPTTDCIGPAKRATDILCGASIASTGITSGCRDFEADAGGLLGRRFRFRNRCGVATLLGEMAQRGVSSALRRRRGTRFRLRHPDWFWLSMPAARRARPCNSAEGVRRAQCLCGRAREQSRVISLHRRP